MFFLFAEVGEDLFEWLQDGWRQIRLHGYPMCNTTHQQQATTNQQQQANILQPTTFRSLLGYFWMAIVV